MSVQQSGSWPDTELLGVWSGSRLFDTRYASSMFYIDDLRKAPNNKVPQTTDFPACFWDTLN